MDWIIKPSETVKNFFGSNSVGIVGIVFAVVTVIFLIFGITCVIISGIEERRNRKYIDESEISGGSHIYRAKSKY